MHQTSIYRWLGALPAFTLTILIVIILVFAFSTPVFNPPYFLLALNVLFLTGTCLLVTVVSAKCYLIYGSPNILLIGSSTLLIGLVALASGWAAAVSSNAFMAIFDVGLFSASMLLLLSSITNPLRNWLKRRGHYKFMLLASYCGVVAFVLVLAAITIAKQTPIFFAAQGSTALGMFVLASSILFFFVSSLAFGYQYIQLKSPVLYWCSLGLGCFAVGLFGIAVLVQLNSILNWAAWLTLYAGGLYFLIAILRHKAGLNYDENISLSLMEAFGSDRQEIQALYANLLNGFAYQKIITDKDGKPIDYVFLEVNDAFEQITGLSKKEVVGKKATEILPSLDKEHDSCIRIFGRIALTGESTILQNYFAPLDRWYRASVYSPKKGYFISIFEDITKNKKAEKALEESEKRFRQLALQSPDAIYLFDPASNKIEFINRDEFLGYSSAEFEDSNAILKASHPDDRDLVQSQWRQVLERTVEGQMPVEYRLLSKFGDWEWVQSRATTLTYDEQDKPTQIVVTLTVITERKRLQNKIENYARNLEKLVEKRTKQLKSSERLATIGAIAGMVGHDVRNPLQAIAGDLYLAQSELMSIPDSKEKENVLESIVEIGKNVDYIGKIVSDLQDYARPLKPRIEETDIECSVKEILAKNEIPDNIAIDVNVEDKAKRIMADSSYIKRILENLILNAIQAMPNGGKLTINAYRAEETGKLTITVEDTGVGIPESAKQKLFSPMFTTKAKGQGFGLAVVKRMTEALGGTVAFESKLGRGTKLIVCLPLAKK